MDWLSLGYYILASLLSAALQSAFAKNKFEKPKQAQLSDFTFPTAQEGRPWPRIWGTVKVAPNLLYYGNLRVNEATKKVRTGLFKKEKQTLGYKYSLTMWLGLNYGKIDELKAIYVDERLAWSGSETVGADGAVITVSPSSYWGTQEPQDGMAGTITLHSAYKYAPLPLISSLLGADNAPVYPYFTHCTFDGFVGVNGNVPPLYFVIKRYADLTAFTDNAFTLAYGDRIEAVKECAGGSANPAFALAEIITQDIPIHYSNLDRLSFLEVAERLHSEGQGIVLNADSTRPAEEIAMELMKQCNMGIYEHPTTGLLALTLLRPDDAVAYSFDESNIQTLANFARTTNEDATNFVQVPFLDTNSWNEAIAQAQDLGAIDRLNGQINKTEQRYPCVGNADLAATLALRDLQAFATPLCRFTITALLPTGTNLKPGDLLSVSYANLGLVNGKFRVAKIDFAEAFKQVATIAVVQDIFHSGGLAYSTEILTPPSESIDPPSYPVLHSTLAPFALTGDEADHALFFLTPSDTTATQGKVAICDGSTWVDTEYEEASQANGIAFRATATGDQLDLIHDRTASTFAVDFYDTATADLFTATLSNVLVLIKHSTHWEFAKATQASKNGAGKLELTGLKRGLYGSLTASGETTAGNPTELYVVPSFYTDPTPLQTALPWNTLAGVSEVVARAIGLNAVGRGSFTSTEAETGEASVVWAAPRAASYYAPLCMLGGYYGASIEANAQSIGGNPAVNLQHRNRANGSEVAYHDYATNEAPPADYSVNVKLYKKPDGETEYEALPYWEGTATDETSLTPTAVDGADRPAFVKAVITTTRTNALGDLDCGSYELYWKLV